MYFRPLQQAFEIVVIDVERLVLFRQRAVDIVTVQQGGDCRGRWTMRV